LVTGTENVIVEERAVLLPFGVKLAGEKLTVDEAGRPAALNVKVWLKPPLGWMAICTLPVPPPWTVMVVGDKDILI